MSREILETTKAPEAIGPYSQGIKAGSYLFCSGQIPLDPKTMQVVGNTVEEQTRRVMENIRGLLEAAGSSLASIVKTTVFLKDMGSFPIFNSVYESYFKPPYPARSTVEVARLPKDVLVEIEVIAFLS